MKTKPIALIIMDGYGIAGAEYGNAIVSANVGVIENLKNNLPFSSLNKKTKLYTRILKGQNNLKPNKELSKFQTNTSKFQLSTSTLKEIKMNFYLIANFLYKK